MIDRPETLRSRYPDPTPRALAKQIRSLERHSRRFIGLSPFVVIATGNADGLDASPRGGPPGFVRVVDDRTLWLPDSPGNNRLDSMTNLLANDRIGLLFLVPGIDETLRVNGRATLRDDPATLETMADGRRVPKVVLEIAVDEVYLHCAKALMRSKLWHDDHRVERGVLPTLGQMINDQAGLDAPVESQESMVARYTADL
jgi:PPOX class probable FMN-dependent enzyme